jgi:hypothetical protein
MGWKIVQTDERQIWSATGGDKGDYIQEARKAREALIDCPRDTLTEAVQEHCDNSLSTMW